MEPEWTGGRLATMRALLIVLALGSGASAQPPQPDAVALFLRSAEADKPNSQKASQYAYREYKVTRQIDKNGKETERRTETWDVIGLEGSTYRKLILRNDQPLPPKEQKREDERLAKETAVRRKENSEQRHNRLFSFSYSVSRLPPERLMSLFDLEFKGEEEMDGRPAYVIAATPKPGARPENVNEKENLNYRMKWWLDREDQVTSRSEMEVMSETSHMQKGSFIGVTSARNDIGVWLLKEFHMRYSLRFFKLANARGEVTQTYSDYRRFQADSRVIDAPQQDACLPPEDVRR